MQRPPQGRLPNLRYRLAPSQVEKATLGHPEEISALSALYGTSKGDYSIVWDTSGGFSMSLAAVRSIGGIHEPVRWSEH